MGFDSNKAVKNVGDFATTALAIGVTGKLAHSTLNMIDKNITGMQKHKANKMKHSKRKMKRKSKRSKKRHRR